MTDLTNVFDRVFCINVEAREDRWREFQDKLPRDWPFRPVQRAQAIDGRRVTPPLWWKQGGGAWGCYRSHLRLIEQALNEGVNSVLLMEDDAVCCDGFAERATAFLRACPQDWQMLYFGGQHLFAGRVPPQPVNELVYRPFNVNRTHAFALRGEMLTNVYQHLCRIDWEKGHHIDHHLGRLHQRREDPIYCPHEWLIGQAEGKSTIGGRYFPERFWPTAKSIQEARPDRLPFVAVLGLHSSGSSCLAGILHHLGLHLGNQFTGHYGDDPNGNCGFEAVGLQAICEQAIHFPACELAMPAGKIEGRLRAWINEKRREAYYKNTIAGGKYPLLCRLGPHLLNVCGDQLRVVVAQRPIEESIRSLQRRFPQADPESIATHQRWLEEGKQELLAQVPSDRQLAIDYERMLSEIDSTVNKLAEFLDLQPTAEELTTVHNWVDPTKRHVIAKDATIDGTC